MLPPGQPERAAVLPRQGPGQSRANCAEAITQLDEADRRRLQGTRSDNAQGQLAARAEHLAAMKQFKEAESLCYYECHSGESAGRRGRPGPLLTTPLGDCLRAASRPTEALPRLSARRRCSQQIQGRASAVLSATSSSSITCSNKMATPGEVAQPLEARAPRMPLDLCPVGRINRLDRGLAMVQGIAQVLCAFLCLFFLLIPDGFLDGARTAARRRSLALGSGRVASAPSAVAANRGLGRWPEYSLDGSGRSRIPRRCAVRDQKRSHVPR